MRPPLALRRRNLGYSNRVIVLTSTSTSTSTLALDAMAGAIQP
jgi:hypothetical protein